MLSFQEVRPPRKQIYIEFYWIFSTQLHPKIIIVFAWLKARDNTLWSVALACLPFQRSRSAAFPKVKAQRGFLFVWAVCFGKAYFGQSLFFKNNFAYTVVVAVGHIEVAFCVDGHAAGGAKERPMSGAIGIAAGNALPGKGADFSAG